MDQLVAAFRVLRAEGMTEAQALRVSRDPLQVLRLFPVGSLGALRGTAEVIVTSGCAECAVNMAYTG